MADTNNTNSSNSSNNSSKKAPKMPNVRNGIHNTKSAFAEVTGQSVTPLEFARQRQQIENQTNYQTLRIDRAKLTQEARKADIEEKRIEVFDAQYKEIGHKVDTAWLKADLAEIEHQTTLIDKDIALVQHDVKQIELAAEKDGKALAQEKRELNYLKGLEDLRALSLGLSEKTYENDTREVVLEVNGSEISQNTIPSKATIKAFLISE
ncbi:hypothetical protein [Scytonema sp. PCC 10023]|uniref:hypothetical protein n=1 Tax=Scytonema sp. PCC 10023 TaxID=1680591 RepID=UPI0039C70E77